MYSKISESLFSNKFAIPFKAFSFAKNQRFFLNKRGSLIVTWLALTLAVMWPL